MIYTSYEMVRDCRANRPEGWAYFVKSYVPVIRKLAAHYAPGSPVEPVLTRLHAPESRLFTTLDPVPERWFVAEFRQHVLAELPAAAPSATLDLETVSAAFEPLTMVEKQAAWIEGMGYDAAATGAMMRMAPETVAKIRARSAELLRGAVDRWNRSLLLENGRELSREAASGAGKDCLSAKLFLDLLDGRTTWRGRETLERHALQCWHCIDHFCRLIEAAELLRGIEPLSDAEAAPFHALLGIETASPSLWKRLAGRR